MPLKPAILNKATERSILRKIRFLQKSEIIIDGEAEAEIAFPMFIQLVPKNQIRKFSFGKPEGLRVFVQEKRRIIAAMDFSLQTKVLKLVQIHQGPALKTLIKMINALEKKYEKRKSVYHVELISFLFTRGLYVLVRSGKTIQFYYGSTKKMVGVSPDQFKAHIEETMKDQQNTFFE